MSIVTLTSDLKNQQDQNVLVANTDRKTEVLLILSFVEKINILPAGADFGPENHDKVFMVRVQLCFHDNLVVGPSVEPRRRCEDTVPGHGATPTGYALRDLKRLYILHGWGGLSKGEGQELYVGCNTCTDIYLYIIMYH